MTNLLRTSMPTMEDRLAAGRALRNQVPRGGLGRWRLAADRPDPVDLVEAAHEGRQPWLVPVRVGRMLASPYAFLRGSAVMMAEDLAHLPRTGIEPVICGDAHLGNFGFYALPERDLVFDLSDFDEAHPGPWEGDLRRLVTSVWVAGGVGLVGSFWSAVPPLLRRMRQHADVIVGRQAGTRGACAAQGLPAVAPVDTTACQPAASTP
jgi:Uncharacterized protein conserved in bacteria (DUF2252)